MNVYRVTPRQVRDCTVRPPGSKSITNRALITAALAAGESQLIDPLRSDDTEAMLGCLSALGVRVRNSRDKMVVSSSGTLRGGSRLDARASGTTARFITAAATLADGESVVDGVPRMRERPIGPLVAALRGLGARISAAGGDSYPPVRVGGGGLRGGRIVVDGTVSSQFASAVMLSAPKAKSSVTLELDPDLVSKPYLTTTLEVMAAFGAVAGWAEPDVVTVEPTGYEPRVFPVEADASAAVYPWAAAAVSGATVTVVGLDPTSTQADMGALDILRRMGCRVSKSSSGVAVTGPPGLKGVAANLNHCPDAALGLAVVAAFASSESRFTDIANLRLKETDRLAALESELRRLGVETETGGDWIRIQPGPLRPARIRTYDDHRMAMSFAIAGLVQPGITIEDPGCVTKTWPTFFRMLEEL